MIHASKKGNGFTFSERIDYFRAAVIPMTSQTLLGD